MSEGSDTSDQGERAQAGAAHEAEARGEGASLTRREALRLTLRSSLATLSMGGGLGLLDAALRARRAPAWVSAEAQRPLALWGVMSGEVTSKSAVVWSRADRPATLHVRWSTDPTFRVSHAAPEAQALPERDLTARVRLSDLPPGRRVFYMAHFESLLHPGARSLPLFGELSTAPVDALAPVRFAWSGDSFGQGYGINPQVGGVRLYESVRLTAPDLFIHCGDRIYADQPLKEVKGAGGGRRWHNLLTPEVQRVAESLDDFRGYYRYTLLDEPTRRLYQVCPQVFLWDDHEVKNDWFPGRVLRDKRYAERRVDVLAARSRQAFFEYSPLPMSWLKASRLYRRFPYGPLVEVFALDGRSYRGDNHREGQVSDAAEGASAMWGAEQLRWLIDALSASKARWKIVACAQPLALAIGTREGGFDGFSSGSAGATGRELEVLTLLRALRAREVKGVVWVTADVHYAAAHHFHPDRATVGGFDPFWEFVAGPINAATLGPKRLDPTFGPQVEFISVTDRLKEGLSPLEDQQFYGMGEVNPDTQALTITLHDLTGKTIFQRTLAP